MEHYSGEEHGVSWELDKCGIEIHIKVKQIDTGLTESTIYHCSHAPVFGYDIDDVAGMEQMLENLISKYATDGYKPRKWNRECGGFKQNEA